MTSRTYPTSIREIAPCRHNASYQMASSASKILAINYALGGARPGLYSVSHQRIKVPTAIQDFESITRRQYRLLMQLFPTHALRSRAVLDWPTCEACFETNSDRNCAASQLTTRVLYRAMLPNRLQHSECFGGWR